MTIFISCERQSASALERSVKRVPNTFFFLSFELKDSQSHLGLKELGPGVGVMKYVRDNIPSKLLTKHFLPNDIEDSFVELNFRKRKWLLIAT